VSLVAEVKAVSASDAKMDSSVPEPILRLIYLAGVDFRGRVMPLDSAPSSILCSWNFLG